MGAVNRDNDFHEDDDLGITEETAAAIDSIVSSIDVVEELHDDVDLGLDVIDDPGDVSDHHEPVDDHHQSSVEEDQQSLAEPQQEDPQNQEISYEEPTSVSGAPVDALSQNFYRTQARVPVLCLVKLRIGSDCISSLNGRIDLKKLQKASPGLFPKVIKLTGTKGVSSKGNNANNAKGKKENSAAASPVKK